MFKDDPDQLRARLPRLRVLARSSPTDKHVLVGLLMDLGFVVGTAFRCSLSCSQLAQPSKQLTPDTPLPSDPKISETKRIPCLFRK